MLIVGGTGFIGYHLAKKCLRKKWYVFSFSKNKPRKERRLKKINYLIGDLSNLKDLKKEFTFAFKNADKVILFPIYTAGEKIKLGFNYVSFAKEIIKNSKVQLFLVDDKFQLAKFVKANIYGKKIVIGMGAGTISNWMKKLPQLM